MCYCMDGIAHKYAKFELTFVRVYVYALWTCVRVETPKPFLIDVYKIQTYMQTVYTLIETSFETDGPVQWKVELEHMLANVCVRELACVYVDIVILFFYYFVEISYTTDDEHDVSISFARPSSLPLTRSLFLYLTLSTDSYDFSPSLFQTIQNQIRLHK